jgi:hypothetical protein
MAEAQLAPNANDGTLDGAVAALANVDVSGGPDTLVSFEEAANRNEGLPPPGEMAKVRDKIDDERQKALTRAPDGRFKAADEAPPADPKTQAPPVDASDVAEEYFELPPEQEGGEPRRIPAKEVFEGYQERETLRQELEQARRVQPPPQEWDKQMLATVQTRSQLTDYLDRLARATQPVPPDDSLIDASSPRYDPDAYQRQLAAYRSQHSRLTQINAEREAQNAALAREQNALLEARKAREQSKLVDMWPEIKDPATQRQVVDEAARFYGITPQDFAQTYDSRMYALLKDALAYRASQNQRQAAVKVVRSVPKLVRAQARDTRAPAQRAVADGMRRLSASGSLDDAADVIGGLLG